MENVRVMIGSIRFKARESKKFVSKIFMQNQIIGLIEVTVINRFIAS